MDGLGTVKHDYTTPRLDDLRERAKVRRKEKPYTVSECYRDHVLNIREQWHRCFSGREEYA